jgi:uncharacterized membrane protein
MRKPDEAAAKLPGASSEALNDRVKTATQPMTGSKPISRNVMREFDASTTFGQRAADKVATFGGSWTFVGLFAALMLSWVILNALLIAHRDMVSVKGG